MTFLDFFTFLFAYFKYQYTVYIYSLPAVFRHSVMTLSDLWSFTVFASA